MNGSLPCTTLSGIRLLAFWCHFLWASSVITGEIHFWGENKWPRYGDDTFALLFRCHPAQAFTTSDRQYTECSQHFGCWALREPQRSHYLYKVPLSTLSILTSWEPSIFPGFSAEKPWRQGHSQLPPVQPGIRGPAIQILARPLLALSTKLTI